MDRIDIVLDVNEESLDFSGQVPEPDLFVQASSANHVLINEHDTADWLRVGEMIAECKLPVILPFDNAESWFSTYVQLLSIRTPSALKWIVAKRSDLSGGNLDLLD